MGKKLALKLSFTNLTRHTYTTVDVHYAISSITCVSYIYCIRIKYRKLSLRWAGREKTQTKEVCLKSPDYSWCSDPEPCRPGPLCFTRKLAGRCN